MGSHLIDGTFQSDKYPSTPRGKVPLSVKDKAAQDLLWEYAQRRRSVDAEFSDDLETALRNAGFDPKSANDFEYHELLMLRHAIETLYRQERGEPEKAPYHGDAQMSTDQWDTLVELRRKLRRVTR